MLQTINLCFNYPEKNIIHQMNLTLNPGELIHIQGANGSGKTTLLKLLLGLLKPTSGDIQYKQHSILKEKENTSYQQARCYVGHKLGIDLNFSPREQACFDISRTLAKSHIEDTLRMFSLLPLAHLPCAELSAGEKKRVSLMRVRLSNAPIWILDEPLASLDTASIKQFCQMIDSHLQNRGMVILTSHQPLLLDNTSIKEVWL